MSAGTPRAGMGFRDHFSHDAAGYAAARPSYPPQLAEVLARLCFAREVAWEAGCGSGQLSLLLAEHFGRVVASDASAEQLAAAPAHPAIEWRCARAEESGLAPRSVDLVVAAQAAHWFDLPRFYAEARRVARPGALLALVSYGKTRIAPDLDPIVDHFHDVVLAGHWPSERAHVVDGYRSLGFPFEPLLLPPLEIRREWSAAQFLDYVGTWSGVHALRQSGGSARFESFAVDLSARWRAGGPRRQVRWPLAVLAARLA